MPGISPAAHYQLTPNVCVERHTFKYTQNEANTTYGVEIRDKRTSKGTDSKEQSYAG